MNSKTRAKRRKVKYEGWGIGNKTESAREEAGMARNAARRFEECQSSSKDISLPAW